ncbi:MAG: hypothetical protein IJZ74_00485 [Clostridia bacterium]|nr:hypothetical protein [Clostridia bacterium]
MNKNHRIWAVIGVVLVAASIVCMLAGALIEPLRALLMNISLMGTIAALAILVVLGAIRNRAKQQDDQQE